MATLDAARDLGLIALDDFREAQGTWPRGDRPAALRAAAAEFRPRFREGGMVEAIRTIDLVEAAYPAAYAFHGAATAINPYVSIRNRLVVVQYRDPAGERR